MRPTRLEIDKTRPAGPVLLRVAACAGPGDLVQDFRRSLVASGAATAFVLDKVVQAFLAEGGVATAAFEFRSHDELVADEAPVHADSPLKGPKMTADNLYQSSVPVFRVQSAVLRDPALSDAAKLLFCRLVCQDGFRIGWLFSDSRWDDATKRLLAELGLAGHLDVRLKANGEVLIGACLQMVLAAAATATETKGEQ